MSRIGLGLLALLFVVGCYNRPADVPTVSATYDETAAAANSQNATPATEAKPSPEHETTLLEARAGFKTRLTRRTRDNTPPDPPPQGILRLVRYESPAGKLA